ncbi:hypothetical protein BGZ95_006221 [Linnemannia exigua]|uniref:DDE Tnp4 domain-containing protein n=1 Tax=Linnemannia exigua TaxID=604196 RepID=A0AAD4DLK1_9FUNG|nr:hypothetical protein BGZ95_006221 [Linnemannia exigua]
MARHPSTPSNTIHKEFYMHNPAALSRLLTAMLSEMFSMMKLRLLAAERNPELFKYVTLNLDGHDSRIIYVNEDKASLYSYKLKKPGFRVQVCTNINNMVLFVSAPAPRRDYNDGTMLLRMGIQNKIYKLDCVALDGGYSLFIGKLLDSADELQYENFCYPIRKMRGIALTEEKKVYNEIFGSFSSHIDGYFGEMQSTFTKFSRTVVNKVAEKETFGVQYKLACFLMSIKRFLHSVSSTLSQKLSVLSQSLVLSSTLTRQVQFEDCSLSDGAVTATLDETMRWFTRVLNRPVLTIDMESKRWSMRSRR